MRTTPDTSSFRTLDRAPALDAAELPRDQDLSHDDINCTQPPTHTSSVGGRASPQSRPLREAATYVGLVTLMTLGVAFALPHAGIARLLSMVTPLIAVVLITFLRTPRGHRKQSWGSLGVRRPGLRSLPAAVVIAAAIVFVVPYGVAELLGNIAFTPLAASFDVWVNGAITLVIDLVVATILGFTEEIGWRGYLLPRVQALVPKRHAALVVGSSTACSTCR